MSIHPGLQWLAAHVSKWPEGFGSCDVVVDDTVLPHGRHVEYKKEGGQWSFFDWQLVREAWLESTMTPEEEQDYAPESPKKSKYHREIKPGVRVDVYDVLHAWRVQNPALQHLIKKALQPGERGHKTREQDMDDIVASALRAKELEG